MASLTLVETTGATPPEGAKGAFPPFQTETFASQLLWFAIAFGLLYWLMSRVALPRVSAILEDRSRRLANDLDQAERLRSESDAMAAEAESSLAAARARAKEIAQASRDKLAAESEARRKALEADLAHRLASAEETISTRTREALQSVRGIAADTTAAIVERLTGRAPDPAAVQAALDRAGAR
jgi:F-type H+-transporting ATPase subunit b